MNSMRIIFWSTLMASAIGLVACNGQKKEENQGRPPLPAGVTAGVDTAKSAGVTGGAPTSTTASTVPVVIDGKRMEALVTDIQSLNGPMPEGQGSQISLTITLDGKVKRLSIDQASNTEQVSYYESGDYVVTYASRCATTSEATISTSLITCGKFYFVAWVSNRAKGIHESQFGVVKLLDGGKFESGLDQYSLAITSDKKELISSQAMVDELDKQTK